MRSVLYRFPDLAEFERLVGETNEDEAELGLPSGEAADDGEWILAIFELGAGRRATSAAARAIVSPEEGARLVFEPRDWTRLAEFAETEARQTTSLPAVRDSEAPRTPTQRNTMRPLGESPRVLIVDDDPDIRDVVSAMLEAVGLLVVPVESAEEALDRVFGEPFDLLVLDWNLPKMTGLDLCRIIRKDARFAALPVLFLTANASSQDMVDAFASGGDDYVVKPFRAPELGARIFSLLRRSQRASAP